MYPAVMGQWTAGYRRDPRRIGGLLLALLVLAGAVSLLAGVGGVGARSQGTPLRVVTVPSSVCHGAPVKPKLPQNLPTAPDPSLLAILGVLRRPQVSADIPPVSRFPDPGFLQGVEVSYERLLATTAQGQRFFLIPGFFAPPSIPSNCSPPLSPKERRRQQQLQQQLRRHPQFIFLISQFGSHGSGGGGGAPSTAAAIMAGVGTGSGFGVGAAHGRYQTVSGEIDGLVPDGVASVTLKYRRRADRTIPVLNNFFVLSVHGRIKRHKVHRSPQGSPIPPIVPSPFPPTSGLLGAIAPIEIVWRDALGNAIKKIKQPAYCAGKHGAGQLSCFRGLAKNR